MPGRPDPAERGRTVSGTRPATGHQHEIRRGAMTARVGEVAEHGGVTIIGTTNLPSLMSFHASQLYSRNVAALLQHLAPEGELVLDWDDEITAGACVTRPEPEA